MGRCESSIWRQHKRNPVSASAGSSATGDQIMNTQLNQKHGFGINIGFPAGVWPKLLALLDGLHLGMHQSRRGTCSIWFSVERPPRFSAQDHVVFQWDASYEPGAHQNLSPRIPFGRFPLAFFFLAEKGCCFLILRNAHVQNPSWLLLKKLGPNPSGWCPLASSFPTRGPLL